MSSAGQRAGGSRAVVLAAAECLHICVVTLASFFLTDLVVARAASSPSRWLALECGKALASARWGLEL